jgi:hypothetical protein
MPETATDSTEVCGGLTVYIFAVKRKPFYLPYLSFPQLEHEAPC